jgi:hypothetical protein
MWDGLGDYSFENAWNSKKAPTIRTIQYLKSTLPRTSNGKSQLIKTEKIMSIVKTNQPKLMSISVQFLMLKV